MKDLPGNLGDSSVVLERDEDIAHAGDVRAGGAVGFGEVAEGRDVGPDLVGGGGGIEDGDAVLAVLTGAGGGGVGAVGEELGNIGLGLGDDLLVPALALLLLLGQLLVVLSLPFAQGAIINQTHTLHN